MLKKLTVSNLAVVERAEVDFSSGLTVVTGETGAGKSVLMGAIELALGGRAAPDVVRDGAKEAEVEAEFDGHVVRRTVTAGGRSRAWIDDESVSLNELRDFAVGKVDIHGPRANQLILTESFQRLALDSYGSIPTADYAAAHAELCEARKAAAELEGAALDDDELDLLRYQIAEIEDANLTEADDTLEERHVAAAHAADVVESANAITEGLGGDGGAADTMARLQPRFAAAARHFPAAAEWAAMAEDITVRIQELSRAVADAVSSVESDPEVLDALDRRLSLVNRLKRKYGGDPRLALSAKRAKLEAAESREKRVAEAAARLEAARKAVTAAGNALRRERAAVGKRLAVRVTKELHSLGFASARFDVAVAAAEPGPSGADSVTYLFEPNPGEGARALADVASSGETARVMLALKDVLAAHDRTETLVFDEIDANIGGEIGAAVGGKLRSVARSHQVIAITHLPQSAVFGDRHLVVSKSVSGGRTRSRVVAVDGDARISEIARMLGGENITSVVRKHAKELLGISR